MSKLTILIFVVLLNINISLAVIHDGISLHNTERSHQKFKSISSKRSIPTKQTHFNSLDAPIYDTQNAVNQISFDDAISSNFDQIEGELPADRQVSIVLSSTQMKRFYFKTLDPQTSFSLTITPCETSIRYQLLFINEKSRQLRKRKVRRHSKRYYVRLLRKRLQQHATKLLVNQTVIERFSYTEENILEHGIYILQITNQESVNTSTQIYLSSSSKSSYPILPPVASVLSKQIKSKKNDGCGVEVWWNPVLPQKHEPSFIYEYCVSINEYLKPRSQCLDHDKMMQNYSSNLITQYDANIMWLNRSENEVNEFLQRNKQLNKDHYFECTKENVRKIDGLEPEILYRISVFVRNQITGFVSRYWTSNFTLTKPKIEIEPEPVAVLNDSIFSGVYLEHKNRFSKKFHFEIPSNKQSDRLYLFVQPCDGIGPIKIVIRKKQTLNNNLYDLDEDYEFDSDFDDIQNGDILLNEEISETKTFEIKTSRQRYSYEIELNTEDIKQKRSLVILISYDLLRFPFPRMPSNRAIRSLYSMRKCNSVTIAWDVSPDDNVWYCILQRDADYRYSNFEESKEICNRIHPIKPNTIKRELNQNNEINSIEDEEEEKRFTPTRQIGCRRYKSSKRRQNNMIIQNIRHLQPGKRYVFQVVARRDKSRELMYEQVWTETKPESDCKNKQQR